MLSCTEKKLKMGCIKYSFLNKDRLHLPFFLCTVAEFQQLKDGR